MDLIASIYGTHGDDEDDCTNTEVSANEKKRKRVVSEAELRVKKTLGKLEVDLPDFFNASDKDNLDQLVQHKGRKRQFEAIEGNWPTFVRLAIPHNAAFESQAQKAVANLKDQAASLPHPDPVEEVPAHDYHISLCRTFTLRHHEIDLFVTHMKQALETASVPLFALQFDEMECLENDDHSRTFLCASVAEGKDSVCLLISIVDDVLEKFGKPQFYEEPKPHVSIAWTLGAIATKIEVPYRIKLDAPITIPSVQMKIGNREYAFDLMCDSTDKLVFTL